MESISLEMDDIFSGGSGDEDEAYNGGVLPDLPDTREEGNENDDNEATNDDNEDNAALLSKLKSLSKGAAKRVIKNPQPKLDATRLTSSRGIPMLPTLFKDIKLQGKGHEAVDIKRIMSGLEQWAHRLFPKMPFDEVIERIEKLGAKKPVQTCVKRMRLDMPMICDDGPIQEEEEIDGDQSPPLQITENTDAEEAFDEMIRESMASVPEKTSPVKENGFGTDHMPNNEMSQTTKSPLSDEIKERIERNKRLALERRARKMGKLGVNSPVSGPPVGTTQPDVRSDIDGSQLNASTVSTTNDTSAMETNESELTQPVVKTQSDRGDKDSDASQRLQNPASLNDDSEMITDDNEPQPSQQKNAKSVVSENDASQVVLNGLPDNELLYDDSAMVTDSTECQDTEATENMSQEVDGSNQPDNSQESGNKNIQTPVIDSDSLQKNKSQTDSSTDSKMKEHKDTELVRTAEQIHGGETEDDNIHKALKLDGNAQIDSPDLSEDTTNSLENASGINQQNSDEPVTDITNSQTTTSASKNHSRNHDGQNTDCNSQTVTDSNKQCLTNDSSNDLVIQTRVEKDEDDFGSDDELLMSIPTDV